MIEIILKSRSSFSYSQIVSTLKRNLYECNDLEVHLVIQNKIIKTFDIDINLIK